MSFHNKQCDPFQEALLNMPLGGLKQFLQQRYYSFTSTAMALVDVRRPDAIKQQLGRELSRCLHMWEFFTKKPQRGTLESSSVMDVRGDTSEI